MVRRHQYGLKLTSGIDPRGLKKSDCGCSIRDGRWLSHTRHCRSAMRQAQHDLNNATYIGPRVVLKLK